MGNVTDMGFKKSPPDLIARFEAALPQSPLVEPKKMFGYPAAFVHGHFFAGLHEENAVIRLPEALWKKLPDLAQAAGFDPMRTGKVMKDWLVIPATVVAQPKRLAALLEAALALVSTLPPKTKKKTKRAAKQVWRSRTLAVWRHCMCWPPLMAMLAPVTKAASSEQR